MMRRRYKEIARLSRRRYRDEAGQFLVEGVRLVESALRAGAQLLEVIVSDEARAEPRIEALLRRVSVPVHVIPPAEMDRLADTRTTQGVLAIAEIGRRSPDELSPPLVALDGVQDPGNVGAVIRTAAWFGAQAVLIGPGTADPFSPKAARASMGGLWNLDVAECADLAETLVSFRARGIRIHGAHLEGGAAQAWEPDEQAVLVIGSEARGIQPAVDAILDERVRIGGGDPDRGVESLNAAVAAGILLHRWLGGSG
jgi:RNA methyltransferase, TrmH family